MSMSCSGDVGTTGGINLPVGSVDGARTNRAKSLERSKSLASEIFILRMGSDRGV